MRILLVMEYPFPPNFRVEKEVRALYRAGHEVVILCPHSGESSVEEMWEKARIQRVEVDIKRSWSWSWPYLERTYADANSPWVEVVRRAMEEHRPDAVHVVDCPLALPALLAAGPKGLPVVVDFHEYWPELAATLAERYRRSNGTVGEVWSTPEKVVDFWLSVEKEVLQRADSAVCVSPSGRTRLGERTGAFEKIRIVMNGLCLEDMLQETPGENRGGGERALYDFGYVGSFDATRNFSGFLHAVRRIVDQGRDLRVFFGGFGPIRGEVEREVESLGLQRSVRMEGLIQRSELAAVLSNIRMGLILFHPTPYASMALPWKLFEYLYFSEAVISTTNGEIGRVLSATGGGEVIHADSPAGLAEEMAPLLERHRTAEERARGREHVLKHFNWNDQAGVLTGIYGNL